MELKEGKIILAGIVGSHAYGLNHTGSDIDHSAVFVLPTDRVLSLGSYRESYSETGREDKDENPDTSAHEIKKFMTLAADCNPTVLEFLFLQDYKLATPEGIMLLGIKSKFLSNKVRVKHIGYATGQVQKFARIWQRDGITSDNEGKLRKLVRHVLRLAVQAEAALTTGVIRPKLTREEIEWLTQQVDVAISHPQRFIDSTEGLFQRVNEVDSVLPDEPDWRAINETLLEIRRMN